MNTDDELDKTLKAFYKGTLICPYPGCYEKDPVRYIDKEVLFSHTRYSHVAYLDIKKGAVV